MTHVAAIAQTWRKALQLYVHTPELIYASILAAIVIFGFAWWLSSRYSKGHIDMLKEQLRFGKEKQEGFEKQLETLKREVSQQGMIINDLRSAGGVPRTQVELLSNANARVVSALTNLKQANTSLSLTLTSYGRGLSTSK
jgi:orotate phosphoribosyltransferase